MSWAGHFDLHCVVRHVPLGIARLVLETVRVDHQKLAAAAKWQLIQAQAR